MADIELVIKIPEEIYNRFGHEYSEENLISKYTNDIILEAFCNGAPLPKGHGRLKDIDKIERLLDLDKPDNIIAQTLKNIIESVPTIIEADTESEDKE